MAAAMPRMPLASGCPRGSTPSFLHFPQTINVIQASTKSHFQVLPLEILLEIYQQRLNLAGWSAPALCPAGWWNENEDAKNLIDLALTCKAALAAATIVTIPEPLYGDISELWSEDSTSTDEPENAEQEEDPQPGASAATLPDTAQTSDATYDDEDTSASTEIESEADPPIWVRVRNRFSLNLLNVRQMVPLLNAMVGKHIGEDEDLFRWSVLPFDLNEAGINGPEDRNARSNRRTDFWQRLRRRLRSNFGNAGRDGFLPSLVRKIPGTLGRRGAE
ncbi:MAG: hypothetical protein Q9227_000249 [Pyrenula ochraceoflavens]